MESIGCSESIQDTKHQQMTQDEQRDDIKLNGDINGSYNNSEASDNSEDGHTNGEVGADLVPSQENGVAQMEVDCDNDELSNEINDDFDGGDELDQSEIQSDGGDDLDNIESGNDLDHGEIDDDDHEDEDHEDDNHEDDDHEDEAEAPEKEEDRTLGDNKDDIVNGDSSEVLDSDADKTVTGSVTLKSNNKDNGLIEALASGKTGDSEESNKRQFSSKELEDLTKISSRGSLEITLVKKDNDKRKDDKNESETKEKQVDVLTITDTSVEKNDVINTPAKIEDDDIIEISSDKGTPAKKKKVQPLNVTPRRSSRNLNKTKVYSDKESEEVCVKSDDDIEEIIPTDPLADDRKQKNIKKTTIVVNDTKKLVEIAAGSKQRTGKKEPTLVIIDTNTMMSAKSNLPQNQLKMAYSQNRSGFSMVPVNATNYSTKSPKSVSSPQQPKQVLPSLTDDMYVVEAPSFIVPYVYEKPPVTPLKQYLEDMEKILKEQDKKKKKEKAEKEKKDSEEGDKEVKNDTEKMEVDEEDKTEKMDLDDQENKISKVQKDNKKRDDKSEKSDTDTDDEDKDSDDSSKKDSDDLEIIGYDKKKRSENDFENPLGKFFMQIGINLVQEHVQTDLLRNQKRKRDREGKNCPAEVHMAISSLMKTLEFSKENNKPYKLEMDKCFLCNFKSESSLVMAHHLETPHMRNYVYRCNFCPLEVRSPHDILFHMEAKHNVRGRLERAPAYNQCPNCPFEDNQKGKLSRHLLSCAKKYKAEKNQEPPTDWEHPAKIPRIKGNRMGIPGASLYSTSLGPGVSVPMGRLPTPSGHSLLASGGRGRPPIYINRSGLPDGRSSPHHKMAHMRAGAGMVYRPSGTTQPVILPSPYNLYQKGSSAAAVAAAAAGATAKLLQQPSISITPLPRQPSGSSTVTSSTTPAPAHAVGKPGRPPGGAGSSKSNFVICEICDGYIKDLEQLRNHMQWIHKVKIHPKMIYNRPPLNCQKCQFRFFTDQGLERHLLGSHGLVTSSMQEAANKGKDGGRCPVCGRVYQWKLLNHVSRDHNMPLKPAHLSYKCTVCTATFGMYKQFESHVYSAHSVVAKKVMDKKSTQPSTSSSQSDSLLKPLKINDEITIIPQPARSKTKSLPSKNTKVIEF